MILKKFGKKAWAFLKNYWYIPVILIGIVIAWVLISKRLSKLYNIIAGQTESYRNEIDAINKVHNEEMKKKQEILNAYHETIAKLEREYKIAVDELNKKKQKAVKKHVEEYYDDPDSLAKKLSEEFGFKIYKDKEDG